MPKYRVQGWERTTFWYIVNADDPKEAENKVKNGNMSMDEINTGDSEPSGGKKITSVEEMD